MSTIKIYNPGTTEYDNLRRAAALMTAMSPKGYTYRVGVTYFDFGQNWEWTTILTDGGEWGGYQALCPRDHERIIMGDIEGGVKAAMEDKHCPDHVDEARVDKINDANVAALFSMYAR